MWPGQGQAGLGLLSGSSLGLTKPLAFCVTGSHHQQPLQQPRPVSPGQLTMPAAPLTSTQMSVFTTWLVWPREQVCLSNLLAHSFADILIPQPQSTHSIA